MKKKVGITKWEVTVTGWNRFRRPHNELAEAYWKIQEISGAHG